MAMSDGGAGGVEDLIHSDGEAHCPNEECDWWVPEGMEYLFDSHDCHADNDITYEEIDEMLREGQDDE